MSTLWPEARTTLVHLSDLHYGAQGFDAAWAPVRDFVAGLCPSVVFVTGDIVDSPTDANFRGALEALKKLDEAGGWKLHVCPGNHDRWHVGNSLAWASRWPGMRTIIQVAGVTGLIKPVRDFDNYFGQWYPQSPVTFDAGGIIIGVVSLDTAIDATLFARGHFAVDKRQQLTTDRETDLYFVLLHHHLLPVAELESRSADKAPSAITGAATLLGNAGLVAQFLMDGGVDIALHGHQHARHAATYNVLGEQRAPLAILGAASATGNHSGMRWLRTYSKCSAAGSSLNVLGLMPDGSVRLRVMAPIAADEKTWKYEVVPHWPEAQIFSPRSMRRRVAVRKMAAGRGRPEGRLTKIVRFLENRDIHVEWVFERSPFRPGEEVEVINDWGWLSSAEAELGTGDSQPCEVVVRSPGLAIRIPSAAKEGGPLRLRYRWAMGGALTTEELEVLKHRAASGPHATAREFASAYSHGKPLERLVLFVELPAPYHMNDVAGLADRVGAAPSNLVAEYRVQQLTPRSVMLWVDYPEEDVKYRLTWAPDSLGAAPEYEGAGDALRIVRQALGQLIPDLADTAAVILPTLNKDRCDVVWGATAQRRPEAVSGALRALYPWFVSCFGVPALVPACAPEVCDNARQDAIAVLGDRVAGRRFSRNGGLRTGEGATPMNAYGAWSGETGYWSAPLFGGRTGDVGYPVPALRIGLQTPAAWEHVAQLLEAQDARLEALVAAAARAIKVKVEKKP